MSDFQNNGFGKKATRRNVLKGATGAAASFYGLGVAGKSYQRALAQDSVRAQILAIPGVGAGQPTDSDIQQVGALCLEPTKANVQPGEFSGVEIVQFGINNQNLHNVIFRPMLAAWEEYTGAKITWIDETQANYGPKLSQAIATSTIDFDVFEMGAPLEGDLLGRGLGSVMPDWVKSQIEMDDYVGYLQAPVGTWGGNTHRISIDGDCHNFNFRTDVFASAELATEWTAAGGEGDWAAPRTWSQVKTVSDFLNGKQLDGQDLYGYLDPLAPWGGFAFYFLESRATGYAKHPDDKAWLFDADTMKPRINNPAFVRAIQDVLDNLPNQPAGQITATPNETAFTEFLAGTGSMLSWWGDVGSNAYTNDQSIVQGKVGFDILPGSEDVYNSLSGQWETLPSGPNFAPNMAYIGWGLYVTTRADDDPLRQKAAWSAAAHLGGKDVSLWMAAYPSGFQPYRNSHFDIAEWVGAGYDEAFITSYLKSEADSYNHPNAAVEPRIPGIFQYYSLAEDELAKCFAGQSDAQTCADNIAAAWEINTDEIGREQQLALYQASLGL